MKKLSALFLLIVVIAFPARAWVPETMNYQGYLAAPNGAPLDTVVSMTFRLYNHQYNLLWTEVFPMVTVEDGLFSATLGETSSLPDSAFDSFLYLGITVGNDGEMSPLISLKSVPFAFRVGSVDGAHGGHVRDKLSIGNNNSLADFAVLAAGENNDVSGEYSSISGGVGNSVNSVYSHIGNGADNIVNAAGSTCGGGYSNEIIAVGSSCVIGGGYHNLITGIINYSTISGGADNIASGDAAIVGSGRNNRARAAYSAVVSGGGFAIVDSNSARGVASFIGAGTRNSTTDTSSVVCGGILNAANGKYSFIGGGSGNNTTGLYAVIAGGHLNSATNQGSTVGGGEQNIASGASSTIPGGVGNEASGVSSTAMGFRAKATHDGSFVWADRTLADFMSTANNQMSFRASGGVRIATTTAGTVGVKLDNGDTAWEVLSDSTKKTNRKAVDTKAILGKLASLPIDEWNYTHQTAANTHIGPMAQDFHNLFGYGDDETTISTIDPDGVALAAIQELIKQNQELCKRVESLESQIQTLLAENDHNTKKEARHATLTCTPVLVGTAACATAAK